MVKDLLLIDSLKQITFFEFIENCNKRNIIEVYEDTTL